MGLLLVFFPKDNGTAIVDKSNKLFSSSSSSSPSPLLLLLLLHQKHAQFLDEPILIISFYPKPNPQFPSVPFWSSSPSSSSPSQPLNPQPSLTHSSQQPPKDLSLKNLHPPPT
ncbi:PREDICTED: PRUPE_6G174700 [Prunus dulcis]|uniref:PREDICTED: PRUPE_6G174700 n=1 Tax=Prunus dulcis TaxID=3755 RepID=A0A5E4FVV4_PRUDU|nr:PREDICTED: PRUPE_6G174700 [Prunus dulcis]